MSRRHKKSTKPQEVKIEEVKSEDVKSEEASVEEEKAEETKSEEAKPEEEKAEEAKSEEVMPEEEKVEEAKSEEATPEEEKAEEAKSEEATSEEEKAEETKSEEAEPEEEKAEDIKPDESGSDEGLSTLDNTARKKLVWILLIAGLFVVCVIVMFVFLFVENGWKQTDKGTIYLTYGEAATGLINIDGVDYVFDETGYFHNGWVSANGVMYYQSMEEGVYKGEQFIGEESYNLREDGRLISGLYNEEDGLYIYDDHGYAVDGIVEVDGSSYDCDENGAVLYGWQTVDGNQYYFDDVTGTMSKGLLSIEGDTYYFSDEGIMQTGFIELADGIRYFDANGTMQIGSVVVGSDKYLLGEDGIVYTGFYTDEENRTYYYAAPDGKMYYGWMMLGEEHLYFKEDGTRAEGWTFIDDGRYFFTEEGYMLSGWQDLYGSRYYLADGVMATGLTNIDGSIYYFLDDGSMITGSGWHAIGNNKCYLNDNNEVSFGFKNIDGQTYYFDASGLMVKGLKSISGDYYYFNDDGTMARNTTIGNYQIDANGIATDVFAVITPENLDAYIQVLLNTYGTDPYSIYSYCKSFTYKYREKSDITTMACRMLNYGSGACWDYAALCYKMLTAVGYNCKIVIGVGAVYSEHNWILIEISPGVWRHLDPERRGYNIYMLTDAELSAYDGITRTVRYQWDHSAYPAAQ